MATKNSFRASKCYDFEIIDEKSRVVGNIRVKPSGVLWRPRGSHNWYGLSIDDFATYALEKGTKQKK